MFLSRQLSSLVQKLLSPLEEGEEGGSEEEEEAKIRTKYLLSLLVCHVLECDRN